MEKYLAMHHIPTSREKHNAFQLIVESNEFIPVSILIKPPHEKKFVPIPLTAIHRFYLGQEMIDLGLSTAYYMDFANFSVQVQRWGKSLSVVAVEKQLTNNTVPASLEISPSNRLLGADLEVMAKRNEGGRFVAIPQTNENKNQIGTDRALLRKGNQFFQPIIELRANPQPTGKALWKEFLRLKQILEERAKLYDLTIVADANPQGRFFLGGHIHISNAPPSYRVISLLDSLVALPFSCKWKGSDLPRRKGFGRLGAVRNNDFNGFEYRTLPSWYSYIDDGYPFFSWLETVLFNETIPKIKISERGLEAFYNGSQQVLQKEAVSLLAFAYHYLSEEEKQRMQDWCQWLEIPL